MKLFQKIMAYAFIGLGVGTLTTYIATIVIGKGFAPAVPAFTAQFSDKTSAVGVQLAIFAALGVLQGLAGKVFSKVDNTHSLLTLTAIHYGLIVLPLLLAGWYLRWFQLNLLSFLGMLISISVIYTVVYLVNYLTIKKDIREINTKLG